MANVITIPASGAGLGGAKPDATPSSGELRAAMRKSRWAFIYVGIFSAFINVLMLISPLYMLQLYDRVMVSGSLDTLLLLTVISIFLLFTMGILEVIRSRVLVRISVEIDERLAGRIFEAIFASSVYVSSSNQGQALRDLGAMRTFLTGNGLFAFFDAPWTPLYLAGMFLIHPYQGWFGVAGAFVIFCIAITTELVSRNPLKDAARYSNSANKFTESSLRNAESLRAMGMLTSIRRRWEGNHREMMYQQSFASDRVGLLLGASKALRVGLQVGVLGLGGYLAIAGEISPGMLIAGSILLGRALAPIEQAIAAWRSFIGARAAYGRIDKLLSTFPAPDKGMPLPKPKGALLVEKLVGMPPGVMEPVIKDVSFRLNSGQNLAIVGHSAAGKSTLARMLIGVWRPGNGSVRLDGADVSVWDRENLGPYIGYVPQDVQLFDGTVKENIARFGEVDPEAVIETAKLAGAHDMILRLPLGYDTPTGEGGRSLSGGQRQKIALARALYGMPSLIVLDEPNSNLDSQGEAELIETLKKLKNLGRTLIVITHNLHIVSAIDNIMVLKGGKVEALGPRDQILRPQSSAGQPAPMDSQPASSGSSEQAAQITFAMNEATA